MRNAIAMIILGACCACAQAKAVAGYKGIFAESEKLDPPAERWVTLYSDSSATVSMDTRRIVTGFSLQAAAELPLVWWRFDYVTPRLGSGHYGESRFVALSFVDCQGLRFAQSSGSYFNADGVQLHSQETHGAELSSAAPESRAERILSGTCEYLRTHKWPVSAP